MVHGGIKYISNKVLCHSDYVRSGGFLFMKVFQALIENIREEIFRVKWKVDFGNRGNRFVWTSVCELCVGAL